MSKPVNPAVIGGFTVGAIVLLVLALLIFGAGKEFNANKVRYVVFFDSSLNGLEIGAPVKMQGVKIGQVTDISLQIDSKRGILYKPVVLEVDRTALSGTGGQALHKAEEYDELKANRDKLVANGMRARLETQSLLTGLLYVDLNFYPNKPPAYVDLQYKDLLELPGVPPTSDEIRNTAEEVAEKLRSLPLDEIVQDLAGSLREIKTILGSDDIKRSRVALADTLEELNKASKILNNHLGPILKDSNDTIVSTQALVKDTQAMVQALDRHMPTLLNNTDKTLEAARATMNQAQQSLQTMDNAVGPESVLIDALDSVKYAARAIRDLGDYLQRHPESLLSGKDE
jgi:Paraquat-inducible protein B